MPTYSYTCKTCNTLADIIRKLNEQEGTSPYCNICMQPMTRLYTWNANTFKGKGFYTTDKGDK
jgi:putative FmdB family regulatory protein